MGKKSDFAMKIYKWYLALFVLPIGVLLYMMYKPIFDMTDRSAATANSPARSTADQLKLDVMRVDMDMRMFCREKKRTPVESEIEKIMDTNAGMLATISFENLRYDPVRSTCLGTILIAYEGKSESHPWPLTKTWAPAQN